MNVLIIVLGILGIGVALAALVEACIDAGRKRQVLDIILLVALAGITVVVLITYGDVLMQ